MSTRNPLTLSRQELYELVWSKPVTEVAKEIGLSDVAVAKRCRQVQVPLPPRGYWARVTSGQTPSRPALPKYRDSSSSIRARQRASLLGSSPALTLRAATSSESEVDREYGPEPTVTFHEVANVSSAAERERQESVRLERLRRTREAHASVIRRLEAEAGAWERAKRLHRYLRAARRALRPGEGIEADLEGKAVDILALGERFADQLDPLHPSVRSTSLFDGKDVS